MALDLEHYLCGSYPWRVVANLPYSITTPILFRLIENKQFFDCFFLTLQKEVAQRLVAPSSTKEYGALSIAVQMWSEVKILRTIPPQCFYPRPKVTSALVKFVLRRQPAVSVADRALFETLSRGIFQHRRKQLVNSLAFLFPALDKGVISALLREVGIPVTTRPEELSLGALAQITAALCPRLPNAGDVAVKAEVKGQKSGD
jgi:16S rRNA (adenine1518-N6/adenine1519-N6)-dimethyltransferase